MKIKIETIGCALLLLVSSAMAQDLLPSKGGASPSPSPAVSPSPRAPDLIPPLPAINPLAPGAPELPDLSRLDQIIQQSKLGKEVEDYRAHVEWRQLKNQVVYDPAVVAAKKAAEEATTDLEKRNRLRIYYEIYYARMRALASTPQMVAYLEAMKNMHIRLLAQPRVRPAPQVATQSSDD